MTEVALLAIITAASSAMSAGAHMLHYRKIKALEQALKMQRIELCCLEATTVASLVINGVDSFIWKKKYKAEKERITAWETGATAALDKLDQRLCFLTDRVNNINIQSVDAKLDALIEGSKEKTTTKAEKEKED
jgi:hypothetical protein